jgi:hypothetical protein
MANTKITSRVIADNSVGISALNVTDGTNGQALVTDGSGGLSFASVSGSVSGIDSSADATAITIDSSENVGIGTDDPSVRTHIYDATTDAVLYVDSGNVNGSHARFLASGSVKHFVGSGGGFGLGDVDDFAIRSFDNILLSTGNSSTERVRIDNAGNVGIGQSSPNGKLDVINSGVARLTIGYAGTSNNYYDADNHFFRSANAASYPLRISTTQVLAGTAAYGTGVLAYDRDLGAPNWGMNITENTTFNDNSTHTFTSKQNTHGVLYISDEGGNGFAAMPFYPNAGGGVNYNWNVLDPDNATWSYGAPTISFTLGGSAGLAFSVGFLSGSGQIQITRTAGSNLYRVLVMEFAQKA